MVIVPVFASGVVCVCVCVCVCDRAACVCVTVLDVFRQARAGFYFTFFNSAVVVSIGGDCTRIRSSFATYHVS